MNLNAIEWKVEEVIEARLNWHGEDKWMPVTIVQVNPVSVRVAFTVDNFTMHEVIKRGTNRLRRIENAGA